MVEDDAGKRVIYAVVDEIAGLAVAHGFANDARDQSRSRGHKKPSWLGKNLNVIREQSFHICRFYSHDPTNVNRVKIRNIRNATKGHCTAVLRHTEAVPPIAV